MTKVPLLHIILAHDMTTIKENLDRIVLLFDLRIDLHIDMILVIEIDLVPISHIKHFPDSVLPKDHFQDP